jgi:hypothetical protein
LSQNQLYQQLGKPDENASAKGYKEWAGNYWWGTKMLRIGFGENKMDHPPDDIEYKVYVKNWYNPVYSIMIDSDSINNKP